LKLNQTEHRYKITFPGGEIIYMPLDGKIIDPVNQQSISLPEKRTFSLLPGKGVNVKPSSRDFAPVCLTIYASHQCNLDCTYCYIPQKGKYPEDFIDPEMVASGAEIVAEHCTKRSLPFVVGFHGGNEPLLHPERIGNYLDICEAVAKKKNLDFLPFCTTNGVIPEETANWAAGQFFGITLSWDGPPDFHDVHRKDKYGGRTGEIVENTARIFSQSVNGPDIFQIRCTITSSSVEQMLEITRYFKTAGVKNVEFYPVFQNRDQAIPSGMMPDPEKFVYHFLRSRSYGESHGIHVSFSGTRINDIHNRYCMILQDNLTVTPDGYLTNCFYHTQNYDLQDSQFFFGIYNPESRRLEFDHKKLGMVLEKYESGLSVCSHCFNQFHCSMGCPDRCPFHDQYHKDLQPDCIKEKWLGVAGLLETAGLLGEFTSESAFLEYFHNVSCQRI
jgi:uncharacterized protein